MQKSSTKLLRLLFVVFFLSGSASLIYQVAWQRALTLYYGVGSVSVSIIVSAYMLGLGVGALVGGWLAERTTRPVLWYFVIELSIGAFGFVSLPIFIAAGKATAAASPVSAFAVSFALLLVPTCLMGITLPLLVKIVTRLVGRFLRSVSFLYFINTLGAALGALFGSFALISFCGLSGAVYVAAALNVSLAGLVYAARFYSPGLEKYAPPSRLSDADQDFRLGRLAYPMIFLTGFAAIGFELVWYRMIGVLVKASPYAFSTVLFVYLAGIALGSFIMGRFLERRPDIEKRSLFFLVQALAGFSAASLVISFYLLGSHTALSKVVHASFQIGLHPSLPGDGGLTGFLALFDVLLWPLVFMFAPTLLIGAGFPLISYLALRRPDREGWTVGSIYFSNTLGNLAGGIVTGFALLPLLGSERSLLALSVVLIPMGLLVFGLGKRKIPFFARAAGVMAATAVLIALMPAKGDFYRAVHPHPGSEWEEYFEEGVDGVIMTYEKGVDLKNYINGLGHGFRPGHYFYVETIETMAYIDRPQRVLVIGYGTGSIAEAALAHPGVARVTVVELSGALIKNLEKMPLFKNMLEDQRVELIIDDGRRYLLDTDESWDVIFMDPLKTTTAFSNNLYSREFFELVEKRLAPGGVFMVWTDEPRVVPRTLASVYDHLVMYQMEADYFFMVAGNSRLERKLARSVAILDAFPPEIQQRAAGVAQRAMIIGDRKNVLDMTAGLPINTDLHPASEYYLGLKK